jgi:complex 1 LYR family protein
MSATINQIFSFLSLSNYLIIPPTEIPDSPTRDELRNYTRQEFERNRGVSDSVCIGFFFPSSPFN